MSKSQAVYDHLMQKLVTAGYAFGENLLVKEIAAETGASRQPIMSALNKLSTEGFVRIVPQVGCQVIHPTRSEIEDFFKLFELVERLLVGMAAERRTEDQLLELNIIQQRLISITRSQDPAPEKYSDLNRKFHNMMHQMAHSPLLMRKQRNNFNMCDFFITHSSGFEGFMSDVVDDHNHIIKAIADQNAAKAEQEAGDHIREIAQAVIKGLPEDFH